ncbi:uncharacterized protein CMU_020150 [Cryptosporidium muris RN66]|uniref:Uncharacterized protein n=1 Tax=Cryptosporidium muris (strain RN66) TaxID=441375 RepID=B6AJD4_CRYMR|nr:uncharacterized protein CMU_020150 [Cryptosporidium muris RN66]EEA08272.1 hypothetical protein CMU_020150 [Cryptosporidium muris RN66]|eukprot:XP_002142621.1 hypothetical protein [Cryptosporidium muris RN66]
MGNLIGGTVEPPKSRFGIDETMVPTFEPYKKEIEITNECEMRFQYVHVIDHIIPIYLKKKQYTEEVEEVELEGEFNLRKALEKVKEIEVEDTIHPQEYETPKKEEHMEQPLIRGEYLYKAYEKRLHKWLGNDTAIEKEISIYGKVAADSVIKVKDVNSCSSFNPIQTVRWFLSSSVVLSKDETIVFNPLPHHEGYEWCLTRECIGRYIQVVAYRSKTVLKKNPSIIRAKDLHCNYTIDETAYIPKASENWVPYSKVIGPVLIPDYLAHQVLKNLNQVTFKCRVMIIGNPKLTQDNKETQTQQDQASDENINEEDESEFLAIKEQAFWGVIYIDLINGYISINFNSNLKVNINSMPPNEKQLEKSLTLGFDEFVCTINHKRNISIINMIVLDISKEKTDYELKFRVDPDIGRDALYYTFLSFQSAYRRQEFNWKNSLYKGDILAVQSIIQDEIEAMTLNGYY